MGESLSFLKDGTHGTHSDVDDGPLLLSAKNIKDGTIKWDETDRRIPQEEYEKIHSNFSLKTGDILLTIVGSIGETSILKDSEGLTFQRSVAFLRPKEDILSGFLYTEIQTLTFQKELESRKSTSAQSGIYLGDLAEIPVKYSPSLDEQKAIGGFLLHLDHLITLHQRKLAKLKIVKKAMLENCFPKNGEKVPKFRFSGFTGDWEQRKLSELVAKYEDPVETPHGGYIRLGIRSHAKGTFHEYVEPGHELETAKMHRVATNKLIFNITFAWEHAVAIANENDAGKLVSHRFPQFTLLESLRPEFLKYVILDEGFHHNLYLASPGGAGRNRVLKIEEALDYPIYYPSLEEQHKIGGLLNKLNDLITLHQRKLEKLTIIKKSFLEKMFV